MTLARRNRRVLKQIVLRQIMAKDTEANEDKTDERETTGKLWVQSPDGEMYCLGYAYGGYGKDGAPDTFWTWNNRVWMFEGIPMELVRR